MKDESLDYSQSIVWCLGLWEKLKAAWGQLKESFWRGVYAAVR